MKNAIIIMLFLSFTSIFAQEKIDLKLNLKVGDVYKINIPMNMPTEIEMKMDQEKLKEMLASFSDGSDSAMAKIEEDSVSEQKSFMDFSFEMRLVCKVLSKEKDKYKLEMHYDYLGNNLKSEDVEINYNTKDKNVNLPEDQVAELEKIKKIIGKKFTLVTNEYGKVLSISGYEKALQGIIKKDDKGSMEMESNLFLEQLQPKEFKNNLADIFDVLPGKPIGIGDYWSRELIVEDDMMPFKVKTRFTLKEIHDDYLLIQSESIVYSDKMNSKLGYAEGEGKSTITLSRKDNFSQTQPYTLNLNVSMSLLMMEMKMKTTATCNYEVKQQ
jgi:hypothetical protein